MPNTGTEISMVGGEGEGGLSTCIGTSAPLINFAMRQGKKTAFKLLKYNLILIMKAQSCVSTLSTSTYSHQGWKKESQNENFLHWVRQV